MYKIFTPFFLAFFLSSSLFAQIEVTLPNVSGTCGMNIDIPVTVENFTSVFAAQFSIGWDTGVLQYNSATVVGLPQIHNFGTSQLSNGLLSFSWFDGNASGETLMNGDVLFTMNFTVIGQGAIGSPLSFGNSPSVIEFGGLGGGILPHNTNNGTFLVIDTFSPTYSVCPGNTNATALPGAASAVVNFISPTASDNCDINTLTWTKTGATTGTGMNDASGTAFNIGTTTVTYTATDYAGNSRDCVFDVIVAGTGTTPVVISIADQSVGCNGSAFSVDIEVDNFVDINVFQFSVNWDPAIIQYISTSNTNLPQNLTFGTSSSGSGILTFNWLDNMGDGETLAQGSSIFSIDFNVINTFSTTPITITGIPLGTFAEDINGNQVPISNSFGTISSTDNILPVFTNCPADFTVNAATGACTAAATWTPPTATDNCSVASITSSHNPGDVFPFGTTTVTYAATDGSGNTQVCTFDVMVADLEDPTINCPANVTMTIPNGTLNAVINSLAPTSSNDNCGVTSTIYTLTGATSTSGNNDASGSSFNIGTTTVTYTASDATGNTGTCSFTVTVIEDMPPTNNDTLTVYIAPIVLECDDNTISIDVGLLNAVDITSLQFSINWDPAVLQYNGATNLILPPVTNFGISQVGAGILTYSWFEAGGIPQTYPNNTLIINLDFTLLAGLGSISSIDINSNTTPIEGGTTGGVPIPVNVGGTGISVVDLTAPTFISCPNNITLDSNSPISCTGTASWVAPTATDSCDPAVSVVSSHNPGDSFPVGNTTVTYTATDASGNSEICSFIVTIEDVNPPTLSNCPTFIAQGTDPGNCDAIITWPEPTAFDNCGVGQLTVTSSHASGTAFPIGTTTVTYNAVDANGNAAQPCTFDVTISDNEDPIIVCPQDTTIIVPFGTNATVVNGIAPVSSSDNCGVNSVSYSLSGATSGNGANDVSGTSFNVGTTIVTYDVLDDDNNFSFCTFNVRIIEQNPGGTLTLTATSDTVDCSAQTLTINFEVANFIDIASTQFSVNWDTSVLQYFGHNSTLTPIVGVGTTQTANGIVTFSWFDVDNTTETLPDGTVIFSITYTLVGALNSSTIIDINDNTTPVEASTFNGAPIPVFVQDGFFMVGDGTPPVVTQCPTNMAVNNDAGLCNAVVNFPDPVAVDACSNITTSSTHDSGDQFPVGTTTVTYTFTDDFGNQATCSFDITVVDTEPATFANCPSDINQGTDNGICAAAVFWTVPTLIDNCPTTNSSVVSSHAPGFVFPIDTTIVTYTETDPFGNPGATCTFNVIVIDDESPIITCMADTTIILPFGITSAIVGNIAPVLSGDNCNISAVTYTLSGATIGTGANDASGITYNEGTTLVTYSIVDDNGNTASCSFNVIIVEQNPGNTLTVIAENDTINCDAQTVTIDFTVENFTDIGSLQYSVNWDNTVLQYVNNTPTTLPPNVGVGTTMTGNGILTYSWFDIDGSTETYPDGTLIFSIDFNIIGPVNSNSIIFINNNTTPIEGSTFGGTLVPVFTTDGSFVLTDESNPIVTGCPSDINASTDAGICEAQISWTPPSASDACSNITSTASHNPGDFFPIGMTVVTYTFVDDFGNSTVCSFTVTVSDDEAPTFSNCPNDLTINTDINSCDATVFWTPIDVSENCMMFNLVSSHNPGDVFPLGTTVVTATATDANGNVTVCSFDVIVIDNVDPIITCPQNQTINVNNGNTSTVVNGIAPTGTGDNCMVASISYTLIGATTGGGGVDASGETFNVGTTTVTYTITDSSGNTTTCSFNIEVIELFPPGTPTFTIADNAIDCDANMVTVDILVTDFTNIASFSYTIEWDPTLLSFNGILGNTLPPTSAFGTTQITNGILEHSWTSGNTNGSTLPNGTIYRLSFNVLGTFNSTDVMFTGNATPISATGPGGSAVMISTDNGTIIYNDSNAPIITGCMTVITQAALPGTCQTPVNWVEPTITDDCATFTVTSTHSPGDIFAVGSTIVTYTAMDAFGNVSTCMFTVVVTDNQAPTISCPADITADSDPNNQLCGNYVTWEGLEISDNCGASTIASVTSTHDSGDYFPVGITPVTFTVMDNNGFTASCSFTVTVIDGTTPAIACPQDIEQVVDPGMNGAVVTWNPAFATDNCDFDLTCTANPGDFFPTGSTVVECSVADGSGNFNTCSFTVTITDCNEPIFTNCPGDINLDNEAGLCGAVANWDPIVLNPNCTASGLTCSHNPGDFFPVGTTTVNCTALDINNNTVTCMFNVTVADTENPVFLTCPADITAAATSCTANVTWDIPSTSDNCGVTDTISSHMPGTAFPIGTTTVNYAIRDADNNIEFCSFDIIVEDVTAPTFTTCPADVTVSATGVDCDATYTWPDPVVEDNCGVSSIVSTHAQGGTFPLGTTTVTYTAADNFGNSETCSFNITVLNNDVPSLSCPSDINTEVAAGNCGQIVGWPSVLDGSLCGGATLVCSNNPGDVFGIGTTTVTCTISDNTGIIDQCSFDVNVTDTTPPLINGCPNDIVTNTNPGVCTASVNWSVPNATDQCGIESFDPNISPGSDLPIGTTTITYVAKDNNGNLSSCSFNITVQDNEGPTVTGCPQDMTIPTNSNLCGAVFTWTPPTFSDNCDTNLNVTSSHEPGDTLDVGTTTISYVATDNAGNQITSCSFDVTVDGGGASNIDVFATPSDSLCFGTDVVLFPGSTTTPILSYSWTGPNGFVSVDENPQLMDFQSGDEGVYILTVTFPTGCTGTGNITLVGVDANPIAFNTSVGPRDSLICSFGDETLTFTTSLDPSQYTNLFWINPAGDTINNDTLLVFDAANADGGTYTAVAQSTSGCTSISTQDVFVSVVPPSPTVTGIPENNAICLGESFTLEAMSEFPLGPDDHFNWAEDTGGICAGLPSLTDQPTATITPNCPGTYIYYSSVEIDGCLSILEQVVITVLDTPSPLDDSYTADFESTLFGFDVTQNDTLGVDPSVYDINVTQDVQNGTLVNNNDGTFDYTPDQGFIGMDQFIYEVCFDQCGENFCGFAIVTITTTFDNGCPVPTIITPNGDGLNDELFIPCVEGGENPENQLIIFSEWGDEVYRAEPYQNDWFGTYNNEPLPDGTYFYLFRIDDNAEHVKGFITILR